MKTVLTLSLLALATSNAFAHRCVPNAAGEMKFESRCEAVVTGTTLAECHITGSTRFPDDRGNYPGNYPGNYYPYPPYHTHPWERVSTGEVKESCDVSLDDCKYFAFRALDKYEYRNQCGDLSVGKSVEYKYQVLNADGSVAREITGRMRK